MSRLIFLGIFLLIKNDLIIAKAPKLLKIWTWYKREKCSPAQSPCYRLFSRKLNLFSWFIWKWNPLGGKLWFLPTKVVRKINESLNILKIWINKLAYAMHRIFSKVYIVCYTHPNFCLWAFALVSKKMVVFTLT